MLRFCFLYVDTCFEKDVFQRNSIYSHNALICEIFLNSFIYSREKKTKKRKREKVEENNNEEKINRSQQSNSFAITHFINLTDYENDLSEYILKRNVIICTSISFLFDVTAKE